MKLVYVTCLQLVWGALWTAPARRARHALPIIATWLTCKLVAFNRSASYWMLWLPELLKGTRLVLWLISTHCLASHGLLSRVPEHVLHEEVPPRRIGHRGRLVRYRLPLLIRVRAARKQVLHQRTGMQQPLPVSPM